MLRILFILIPIAFFTGCISTSSTQPGNTPTVYAPFPQGEDQAPNNPEGNEGQRECESVSAETIRTEFLAGINQLRRSGCDCMGTSMPKARVLKWESNFEKYAASHSQRVVSGEMAYQPEPSGDINRYQYETTTAFQNEGANDVARLLVAIQLQQKQCELIMSRKVSKVGVSKQGCYWTVVVQ